jgi:hypothetical protein
MNKFIYRLELITNLMHNFIYSIITLHRDPQHVSSIAVLIFRRTIYIFTVSGIVILCMLPYSAPIKSGVQSAYGAPIKSGLQSALNQCTVWQHTECDGTRYCKYTNCPPKDEHSDAQNMLRITMQCYYRINKIVH